MLPFQFISLQKILFLFNFEYFHLSVDKQIIMQLVILIFVSAL
jgi:hypothetical protein